MNIARISVHRPVLVIMCTLIVILLGGISLWRLPIDLMPDITFPTLSVSTSYANASPEEIEELISRPIEEAMSAVPGVVEVSSSSTEGNSNVRISFDWGSDLDAASNDVRDRLDRIIGQLPDDADRPVLRKFDLASFPILILGASSEMDPVQLRELIEDDVKYRLERVPGVASLDIWGGLSREIHVDLHADRVKALGIPLDQILQHIRAGNITQPAGEIERGNLEVTIRTPGEYTSLDELRNTVIADRNGASIRLAEVADVKDSWQKTSSIARVNGVQGLRLSISKQSGTNTVQVAQRALKEIEKINHDIPQIHIQPIVDSSEYIQRSIRNVGSSALYGGILAILVLLLFLRNVRSSLVIAAAIPISIIATFALLYFCGFTLNLMTLGGLALGVGMLVDNSIVVLENIFRLRKTGMSAEEAAVNGATEVTSAIIASTLTTVVVFLPLVFMEGMSGVMFKQLAYVVAFALLCSLGVALTLVPMLAARALRGGVDEPGEANRMYHFIGALLGNLEAAYKNSIHWALSHRSITIIAAGLLLVCSLALIPLVGSELMPATDEGEVRVEVEAQVGMRIDVVDRLFQRVEQIAREEVPETEQVVSSVGGGGFRGSMNSAQMRISLVPESERSRSSEEIAMALRRKMNNIPGLTIRTRAGQGMFGGGMSGGERLEVEVRGFDLFRAEALANRVKEELESVKGVADVRISRESGVPEERIMVDRLKAADMKLTMQHAADALETSLSGARAGDYREGGDEYRILVKFKDAEKLSLNDLLDQTLINSEGKPVVLRNVVRTVSGMGPVRIDRSDQERVVTVSAGIEGRDLGSIVKDAKEKFKTIPVPRDFAIVFGGDYEDQVESQQELLISVLLALVLVYMVMAAQFESLRDPFVVMFSVPLAAIGVTLILFLTRTTFNIQSYIGCIMLGGIVVNNAILLVDHTNLLRRRDGWTMRDAIEEAGRRRLRPILMTALTTILGLIPLALGLGEGGDTQAPLARAVIGGLTSSTLITLLIVPVVYSIFERFKGQSKD